MRTLLRTLFLLGTLLLLATPIIRANGGDDTGTAAGDKEDVEIAEDMTEDEEEEDDVMVEDEEEEKSGETVQAPPDGSVTPTDEDEEDEEEEDEGLKPSSNATTTAIFTSHEDLRFPAGEIIDSLIGFQNKGEGEFIITQIEGSLRYPQDYTYHVQNFTAQYYNQYIDGDAQASFVYPFMPSEMFNSRAFGFTLNIYYKDVEGNEYMDAVFNDTVNIVEIDEGFDHYTFFMYVFMITGLSLLMFIINYVYTTVVRRPMKPAKRAPIETGTQNKTGVDYDWLPPGTVSTPKKSPSHKSPRNRKNKDKTESSS
ncbi:translocon-associated protein subunit alpha-like [Dysidea avara]|uniref:translocon-associated protein subunit alpha-like n=1 Tax=Dysidea avara TaxID=196820 RepID=UPI00332E41E9